MFFCTEEAPLSCGFVRYAVANAPYKIGDRTEFKLSAIAHSPPVFLIKSSDRLTIKTVATKQY
ncbi:MAG: hypothetical protein QNJ34_03620 [Xenococcaceae cyanobacterium MO_188.B29]|nr:hypothetical protein [Xenococcaceae cyanobacterium MO_188.B29]